MPSLSLFAFGLAVPVTLCLIGELKLMKGYLTIAFRLETPWDVARPALWVTGYGCSHGSCRRAAAGHKFGHLTKPESSAPSAIPVATGA